MSGVFFISWLLVVRPEVGSLLPWSLLGRHMNQDVVDSHTNSCFLFQILKWPKPLLILWCQQLDPRWTKPSVELSISGDVIMVSHRVQSLVCFWRRREAVERLQAISWRCRRDMNVLPQRVQALPSHLKRILYLEASDVRGTSQLHGSPVKPFQF